MIEHLSVAAMCAVMSAWHLRDQERFRAGGCCALTVVLLGEAFFP